MWDFEQVGAASLWKSGPLFSTGAEKYEAVKWGASIEAVLAST
jgi:hypothetical protein